MKRMKKLLRSLVAAAMALAMVVSTVSALSVEEALALLEENYLRPIPAEAYEAEDLDTLFEILGDPYTYYMDVEEYTAFMESMEDTTLVGIGVMVQYTEKGIYVVDVVKGGGAEAAGVKPGDYIIEIDGVSCVPADDEVSNLLMGKEFTYVNLLLNRNGSLVNCMVQRALVQILTVESSLLEGNVGYIDCESFGSTTAQHVMDGLITYGDKAISWLVDMRDNGGGSTDACVATIGMFAGPGHHSYLQDGLGQAYYYEWLDEAVTDKFAVVLVNGNSASAAEQFAGSMRDLGIGLVVGSRSYGKGVAQVLLDSYYYPELFVDDALKVTAYRFFSTGGATNDMVGIIPALLVDDADAEAVAMLICNDTSDLDTAPVVISLGNYLLTLDPDQSELKAMSALLEALPPTAQVYLRDAAGELQESTVAEAAADLRVQYTSRWLAGLEGSPYADSINTLATYDLLNGDSFDPTAEMTRGEVCALLAHALRIPGSNNLYFTDVAADDPNAPYISALCEMGWIGGQGDGSFDPDGIMTQQEYLVVMARALCFLNLYGAYQEIDEATMELVAAENFSSWAVDYAALLYYLETIGWDVEPTDALLAGQAASCLHYVLVCAGQLPA